MCREIHWMLIHRDVPSHRVWPEACSIPTFREPSLVCKMVMSLSISIFTADGGSQRIIGKWDTDRNIIILWRLGFPPSLTISACTCLRTQCQALNGNKHPPSNHYIINEATERPLWGTWSGHKVTNFHGRKWWCISWCTNLNSNQWNTVEVF